MSPIAQLFRQLTHGVYVVGVSHGSECNAFTAAWVMQASFDPLLLALSINPRHASYPLLIASGAFTVNVLRRDQMTLAAHFAQPRCENKLAGFDWSQNARVHPSWRNAWRISSAWLRAGAPPATTSWCSGGS